MDNFNTITIDSSLELPNKLIDITDVKSEQEHFIFQFEKFDENQSDYSIKNGGVTGKFGIIYVGKGMNCHFLCDVTVGNVYDFFIALENLYEGLPGSNTSAVLENYGNDKRTQLSFVGDKRGYFNMNGLFLNKSNNYKSGLTLSFSIPCEDLSHILISMEHFFQEIKRIQGHNKFY